MSIVSTLNKLVNTGSANAKLNLLQAEADNEAFKSLLAYAYKPTLKYYTKGKGLYGKGTQTLEQTYSLWAGLLDNLSNRTISGQAATWNIEKLFEQLTRADADVFLRILNKDLRVGIGLTLVNKAFPGLIDSLKFMKAQKYKLGDIRVHKSLYISLKIDCIRGLLRKGVIYSTNGKPIAGVQHLTEGLPKDLELDMELTIPGLAFDAASGRLRSNDLCPTVLGMVFDVPSVNTPFIERYEFLEKFFEEQSPLGLQLLTHKLVTDEDVLFRNYHKALDAGYEGLVCKTPMHLYQQRRSYDWLKVKPEDPESVQIVDYKVGTGKYAGTLGAVICKRKNGVIVSVGGFTDHMRNEIWNNQEKWRGAIIDIRAHMETPDGSLRHPRFCRERWDLDTLF